VKGRLWWRKNRAIVMPTGVDPFLFKPLEVQSARERLGLSLTDRIVLFNVGKSPLGKRLDLAVGSY